MYGVATEWAHNSHRKKIIIHPNSIPSRIVRRAVKQGALHTIPPQVVVDKISTEKIEYPKLLILKVWKIQELIDSAEVTKQGIICI